MIFKRQKNHAFSSGTVAIATVLMYPENTREAIRDHVDNEDKTTAPIQCTGSNYQTNLVLINESGLYSLIISSKPSAACGQ